MVALLGGTTVVQQICLRMGLREIEIFGGMGNEGGGMREEKNGGKKGLEGGGEGVREKRE